MYVNIVKEKASTFVKRLDLYLRHVVLLWTCAPLHYNVVSKQKIS